MSARPVVRRVGLVAAIAGLALGLTACDPPRTVETTVGYDCRISPNHFLLGPFSDTIDGDYRATAPQAVAPDANVVIEVTPEPFTMDAGTSGGTLSQVSNVVWRVGIPTNATLVSHTIDDWADVGGSTPTSVVSGGAIVVTVPGPVLANVAATFPTVTMLLQATGPVGSRIEPTIKGTSYADPGLTLNARITGTVLGTLNPSLTCFASPNVALHSVLISTDTAAPKVTISAPVANQVIVRNAAVPAAYTCDDGTGVGVASCVGSVGNGSPIDTATLGAKTFTVTASDLEGKTSTATVSYTVVAP